MNLRTRLVAGLAAVAISGVVAAAAGLFPGFPIVGGQPYCVSTLANPLTGAATTTCNGPTTPAGPSVVTGNELIPADTGLSQGQAPQTVLIPAGALVQHGQGSSRNMLIGGDLNQNLWQRGTTPLSSATPSTTTMGADRWAVYSSGNTVTISKQTGATDIIPSAGQLASMRVNRPSTTNTTDICVGQVFPQAAAARALGQTVVFSWYGLNGAAMSATSGRVKATIAYYTASDSATGGTNTDTFMKGTVTGYTAVTTGSPVGFQTSTISSGVATLPQSTTWTRYAVYGAVPTANSSGTAVTGVGVTLCYTPVGTGASGDWIELAGLQLETAIASYPQAGSFSRRLQSDDTDQQLSYSQVLTDGATSTVFSGACFETTANTSAAVTVNLQTMRIVPATTVGTATSFSCRTASGAANACTTLAAVASSNTTSSAGLLCTAAGTVAAGVASQFVGANTAALLTFSAEP